MPILIALFLSLFIPATALSQESFALPSQDTRSLLRLYVAIGDELRNRGITRTENGLTGELGEYIFTKAFGWQVAANSQKSFDALDGDQRYQIKARRQSGSGGSRQLGAIRDLDGFDFLAVVIFDRHYQVDVAALIPANIVRNRSTYVAHTNSWRFIFHDTVLNEPSVLDVTERLRALSY